MPIEEILKILLERYNKNPRGWSILIDPQGNIIVIGPNTAYRLKVIPLGPGKFTGVGVAIEEIDEIRSLLRGVPSFGIRPLTPKHLKVIEKELIKKGTISWETLRKLTKTEPVPLNKAIGDWALIGPELHTTRPLSEIIKGQKELEMLLQREADKLFRERFPHRAMAYI
ncbi:MAG: hypothetical protein ACTSXJ_07890 [Candidatus Baldrarchaeia archaeon]